MTKPKLVFHPYSQEYFDNPYEVYERMRDEAPLYCDEDEDFYALTRHEDVAAAFKDHDAFSSARGCDLGMVRGPVQYNVRYSLKDVEVPSGSIPAGKPVFLVGASANRYPRAFTDTETFQIDRDRTQAQNLGLGYRIHSCLVAALARMETAIALEYLLDFMPQYEVHFDQLERVNMQNVAEYHHVPVRVSR